jgi:ABC-type branched-subunit amino acid transport system ATPase component
MRSGPGRPSTEAMTTILRTEKLKAGYGAIAITRDIGIEVGAGEVVALLGPNGAGKTTTLLTIIGRLPPIDGKVVYAGAPTTRPMYRRAREGMGFVSEERSVFFGLTTLENLKVAGVDPAEAIGMFPELEKRLKVSAGLLSGGEQQMLSLARALCRHPRLLLADELSLGLAPMIVQRLLQVVRRAADEQGIGVLLVEQHVQEVMAFADRAYVMRRGEITLQGKAAELRGRLDEIESSYLASAEVSEESG